MKKIVILATGALLSTAFFSCGGGGGESNSTSSASSSENVVAKVEASIVKGATVCVENTNYCNQTDDNGLTTLKVSQFPVTLTVKISDIILGNVTANDIYIPITPLDIAGRDNQTAEKIGAFIHALVGDTQGNATKIDLTKVKIEEKIDKPLVEILKSSEEPISLTVEVENETHTIEISNVGVIHNGEEVNYDIENLHNLKENEERLRELVNFLRKYNGAKVAFNDPVNQNSTCVLQVNLSNPLQFKFTNCENPENNDSDWEMAFADTDGVKIKDAEGAEAYVLDIDVENGKVEYKFQHEDGTWIIGWLEVWENQQSEEEELSNGEEETEEPEENGVIIEATAPFFPSIEEVKNFLSEYNGQIVKTSDGGMCKLTYNDTQDEFILSNCSNTFFPEGSYEIYSVSQYPNRAFVKAPNGDNDVFFFEDDSTLCTSDGCLYVGDEPVDILEALGDWRKLDVAANSPDLVAGECFYFGENSIYYPMGDTAIRLADYSIDGNLISFTNPNFNFEALSMRVFRISNFDGKTYILTHTVFTDDENLQIFEKVNYCDNE
jgi:hypothetical protein